MTTAIAHPDLSQFHFNQMAENYLRTCTIEHDIRNEQQNKRIYILCVNKFEKYALIEKINGDTTRIITAQNVISLILYI